MNIRNFCIFPDGNSYWPDKENPKRKPKQLRGTSRILSKELSGSRHLWLPLQLTEPSQINMPNPVIVFNIAEEAARSIAGRFRLQPYFYNLTDEGWKDPSRHLPVEAIARAYTYCDKAIEWAKENHERYRQRHDDFLEQLLQPNRTAHSRWILRCRLYGGLLDAYRTAIKK